MANGKKHNLCTFCLNPGHFADQCKSKIKCKIRNYGSINDNFLLDRFYENKNSSDSFFDEEDSNENNTIPNETTSF